MRKLSKTLLSLLLIAAMLASFVVLPAAAEEPAAEQPTEAVQAAETQADDAVKTNYELSIVMLDCGIKYFSVDSIKQIIDNASAAGFGYIMLGVGNDGMRFLLDDMSLTVNGTTYESDAVKSAIKAGNKAYDASQTSYSYAPTTDELTQTEMDAVLAYAKEKGMGVIPMLNTPGHMDAILAAATSLTGTNCSYNGSVRTIDVTNNTAVTFTQELLKKYVAYFAGKGCQYFNMGADEYANDVFTSGSMGFGNLQSAEKYSYYVTYVNDVAAMIKNAGMTPMAFNDGIYFNNNTSSGTFDTDIVICYWSNGWSSYTPMSASDLASKGFKMVNTHGDYYWVLGKSNAQCSASKASGFNIKSFPGSTINDPSGAMFCIWADFPGAETEASVISKTAATIAAFGKTLPDTSAVEKWKTVSEDNTVYDEATGVSVTAPGLTKVEVTEKKDNLPELPEGASAMLAWDIKPYVGNEAYSGEATVTLKLPTEWIGANVYGAVVNEDGTLTSVKGDAVVLDEVNSTITFTVPHFSTVLAVKENKTEVINLTVGQTKSVSLKGEDFTGKITKATDFDTFASLNAAYTPSKTETKIGSKLSSLQIGTTIVLTDGKGNYAKLNSSNYLENTTAEAEATIWTIEKSGSSYYLKSGNNYLNPSNSFSNVSYDVSTSKNNSWKWSSNGGFSYTPYYYYTYYLGYNNSTWGMSTTSGTGIAYGVTTETIDAATTLTFTGVAIGTTYAMVDNIQYKVVVSAEDVTGKSITLEYWITNRPVTADGATQKTINASDAGINTIDGVDIATLVPKNGTQSDGAAVVYYNARRLDAENKQTNESGVDQTTTTKNGCSDITRIRYFGGTWSYFVTERWMA